MILSSLLMVLTVLITAALDRAADSISDAVSANAGASVLTECHKELHERYGIFAIKNTPAHLSRLADYYISEALGGFSRLTDLKLNAAIVDTGSSSSFFFKEFRKQIAGQGKKGFLCPKEKSEGLRYFSGDSLPSKSLPFFAGIDPADLAEGIDMIQYAGNALFITQYAINNFTHAELEYLIFGGSSAELNEAYMRAAIFAMLCIKYGVKDIEEPILLIEAVLRANAEADRIMKSPHELARYLRAMIVLLSGSRMLMLRMMDIMQLSIGNGFYFKDYAYSFELTAQFSRGSKTGVVRQRHSYTP